MTLSFIFVKGMQFRRGEAGRFLVVRNDVENEQWQNYPKPEPLWRMGYLYPNCDIQSIRVGADTPYCMLLTQCTIASQSAAH